MVGFAAAGGSPAYAGMDLTASSAWPLLSRLPRLRGNGPLRGPTKFETSMPSMPSRRAQVSFAERTGVLPVLTTCRGSRPGSWG